MRKFLFHKFISYADLCGAGHHRLQGDNFWVNCEVYEKYSDKIYNITKSTLYFISKLEFFSEEKDYEEEEEEKVEGKRRYIDEEWENGGKIKRMKHNPQRITTIGSEVHYHRHEHCDKYVHKHLINSIEVSGESRSNINGNVHFQQIRGIGN